MSPTRPPTPPPADCLWRLDDSTSATLDLPDGRKLAYAEYGSPTGHPIIYCPGFPSSRVEGSLLDHAAVKVGARIISFDRPSYGRSTPHETRTLRSCAQDVEALTNHLKLPYYGVLGISGGGPYAMACARWLPADKLRAVSLVCGLGSPDMGYAGMNMFHWTGWTFGQRLFPGLCRWWFSRETSARLDLPRAERMDRMRRDYEKRSAGMHPKDRLLLGDPDWMQMHLQRGQQVYEQGTDGLAQDFKVLNSDFGFKVEDIRKDLPVQLWYGKLDNFVPLQHGQKYAARLGDSAQLRVVDETHASISLLKDEYLGELVKAMKV